MLAGAALLAWKHTREQPDAPEPPSSPVGRAAEKALHFFGIGGISLGLAGAVILSVAAVVSAALDIIAVLHFGLAYPGWFPVNAALVGLTAGLGCARLIAPGR
jgi:hypothetical protein